MSPSTGPSALCVWLSDMKNAKCLGLKTFYSRCTMTEEYKCFAWKILQVLFFNKKDIKASEKGVGGLSTRITAPSFVIHLRIRPDLRKIFSWQNSFQDSISSEDNLTKYLLVNLSKLIVDIRPGSLSLRIPYCLFFLRNWML